MSELRRFRAPEPERQPNSARELEEERKQCEDRFQEAFDTMTQQRNQWRDAERAYWNEDTFPSRFKNITQVKVAMPLSIIEGEMSQFNDFLPTWDYLPTKKKDVKLVDSLQKRKEQVERVGHFRMRALDCIRNAQIYGIGIMCVKPEVVAQKLKALDFEVVDPFTFFPSPDATTLDLEKVSYVCFATPMAISAIKRTWEGVPDDLEGEEGLDQYKAFAQQTDSRGGRKRSRHGNTPKEAASAHALVKECYWMAEEGDIKYHIWVKEHTLDNGDFELDELNYFEVTNYKTAHTLMGMSEARMLTPMYRVINRVFSQLANAVQKYGAPRMKVMADWFQSNWNRLTHTPGEQIVVTDQNDVQWEDPPVISPQAFQVLQFAKSYNEDVSGHFEAAQGKLPAGDTSGRAILALQEASQGKTRLKNGTWHTDFMVRVGSFIFWVLKTYDRQTTEIRLEGDDGFDFVQHDGERVSDEVEEVEVSVVGGARLPAGRAAQEARAMELFEKGIYGVEDVLESIDEADRELRLERFRERTGVAAMQQRQEELQEAAEQARKWIDRLIENPEAFQQDRDADHLVELLAQFPELFLSDDFTALPEELQIQLAAQAVSRS